MSNSSPVCKAKNPATCRFHGSQVLAPAKSSVALAELQEAWNAIPVPSASDFFEKRAALDEAQLNYDITKEGLEELTRKAEADEAIMVAAHSTSVEPSRALQAASYDSSLRLAYAESARAGVLEDYENALVKEEFKNDSKEVQQYARLAMLSNFAPFEIEGELDRELRGDTSVEEFYEVSEDRGFRDRVAKIEKQYLIAAYERNVPNKHAVLRDKGISGDSNLNAAYEANRADTLA
jgi:hypothetical protein